MAFEDLYQEIILDHYRAPRNFGKIAHSSVSVEHENPVCGDHLVLMVQTNGRIKDIRFDGSGCAISMASASIMTELVKHKSIQEAKQLVQNVLETMRGNKDPDTLDEYDDLAALKGVIKFPVRVKCATLSWHALQEALNQKNNS
jgi:nitrogen fixation NifU-like protein